MRDDLADAGVIGIEGIDTRRLTLRLRERGAMRCGISTLDDDVASLLRRVREQPGMQDADLAHSVTVAERYDAASVVGPADASLGPVFRVAVVDFEAVDPATPCGGRNRDGRPRADARGRADRRATARSSTAPATRPRRPTASRPPGRCSGRSPCSASASVWLLGLALGGRTFKMKFGHRGLNQPVRDARTGRVEITSHNHGFAVDQDGWARRGDVAETPFGRVELSHWNLNDGTLEGCGALTSRRSRSSTTRRPPGPHDSRPVRRVRELMRA